MLQNMQTSVFSNPKTIQQLIFHFSAVGKYYERIHYIALGHFSQLGKVLFKKLQAPRNKFSSVTTY